MNDLARHITVRDAMLRVANHPVSTLDPIDTPVHELVCRALFDIANNPDAKVRGSLARATRAQKILLTRLTGKRRPGSNPAASKNEEIEFADLTMGALDA